VLGKAREELKTESVFGREYWGEDGIWKFVVPEEGGGGEQMDVVFEDVAGAHPLIKKWEGVVNEEVKRWGVDLKIMDHVQGKDEEYGDNGKGASGKQAVDTSTPPGAKKELSW
jgi:hypothetical protein